MYKNEYTQIEKARIGAYVVIGIVLCFLFYKYINSDYFFLPHKKAILIAPILGEFNTILLLVFVAIGLTCSAVILISILGIFLYAETKQERELNLKIQKLRQIRNRKNRKEINKRIELLKLEHQIKILKGGK